MAISVSTVSLKRYKDIAMLFIKYGRSDLVAQPELQEALEGEKFEIKQPSRPEELAADLEKLGPTFIKLAQLLSTRADLLPAPYMEALARLQDKVEPFPFTEVENIVQEQLGFRLSKAFASFDNVPIAAASLGQVHKATMRDGRLVAVKVQRPNIKKQILEDLNAVSHVASFLDDYTEVGKQFHFCDMLSEFKISLLRELDYRQEAKNLLLLKENLKEFDRIVVPLPVEDYTTEVVLTMEYVHGKKVTSLGPLGRIELEGKALAEQLFAAYLKQILVDGFFHADPHPGNVFLTDDGRIALLDLGMTGQVMPRMQENLLQLILALGEGRGEDVASLAVKTGTANPEFDEPKLIRNVTNLVGQFRHATMAQIQVGTVILEISRIAGSCGLRLPPELTMLGKALANLDLVGRTLDPTFDPNASIREQVSDIMKKRMLKSVSAGNLFSTALETKDFLERLPARVNKILDAAANNELEIKVNAFNETRMLEGMQKIANRITMGLILGSMIVGAAMLMKVETGFRILGYPVLAILFFLIAGFFGLFLVGSILWNDRKYFKKGPR